MKNSILQKELNNILKECVAEIENLEEKVEELEEIVKELESEIESYIDKMYILEERLSEYE
jgi:phage shock protein A